MSISGQICTKFGTGVWVANEMTCDTFFVITEGSQICGGVEDQWFPLIKPVTVNTVLPLLCSK